MGIKLYPTKHPLHGSVQLPGDKSISHRAIMLGAMAKGTTHIDNFLNATDCLHTIKAFTDLGVQIEQHGTTVQIYGQGIKALQTPIDALYVGNSGTTARLLIGILAGLPFSATLTGDASLSKRPMDRVLTPLKQMGAKVTGNSPSETLPITMKGTPLNGIYYKLPVKSAQVKSAILLAGLAASGRTEIMESTPTRDHTEIMLRAFGADIHKKNKVITISNKRPLHAQTIQVPGDISSAAFLLVAAAIVPDSSITIQNVGLNPTRSGLIDCLKAMGAKIWTFNVHNTGGELIGDITLTYQSLTGILIEGEVVPRLIDEIPIIALLATQAHGTTIIRHAAELRIKETDRIEAISDVLSSLGASITKTHDGLHIHGKTDLSGGEVKSYHDHRIAMMAVIASMIANEPVIIDDVSSIAISYPSFFSDIAYLSQNSYPVNPS